MAVKLIEGLIPPEIVKSISRH